MMAILAVLQIHVASPQLLNRDTYPDSWKITFSGFLANVSLVWAVETTCDVMNGVFICCHGENNKTCSRLSTRESQDIAQSDSSVSERLSV